MMSSQSLKLRMLNQVTEGTVYRLLQLQEEGESLDDTVNRLLNKTSMAKKVLEE